MGRVTLTFDNGPEPLVTPQVLDSLARYHLPATFFVLGEKAVTIEGSALVRRAKGDGHRIGSHTWSHRTSLGKLDAASALAEFERGAEAVARLGIAERLFRPPGGGRIGTHLLHPAVIPRLESGGYTCVLWNSVPGDWHDPDGWLARALTDIRAQEWTLLVLHDLPTGAMAHLDALLKWLAEEGHEITPDYPADCLPMVDGRAVRPLAPYLAAAG